MENGVRDSQLIMRPLETSDLGKYREEEGDWCSRASREGYRVGERSLIKQWEMVRG